MWIYEEGLNINPFRLIIAAFTKRTKLEEPRGKGNWRNISRSGTRSHTGMKPSQDIKEGVGSDVAG